MAAIKYAKKKCDPLKKYLRTINGSSLQPQIVQRYILAETQDLVDGVQPNSKDSFHTNPANNFTVH